MPHRELSHKARRWLFRAGEQGGPFETWQHSKAQDAKTLGTMLLLCITLNSARTSPLRRAGDSGLLASWAVTLTLGQPLKVPS